MIATAISENGDRTRVVGRPAGLVDWVMAPDLVNQEMAAHLLGVDLAAIEEIVAAGGVDTVETDRILIDRQSLREYWDLYWELADYAPASQ